MKNITFNESFQNKYRPLVFSQMVGLDYLSVQLQSLIHDRRCNALVFSGLNGHGKSTLADIFLLRLFCENPNGLDACLECSMCKYFIKEGCGCDVYRISGDKFTAENYRYFENHCLYAPWVLPKRVVYIDDLDLADQSVLNKSIGALNRYTDIPMFFTVTNICKLPLPFRQRCKNIPLKKVEYQSLEWFIKQLCEKENIQIIDKEAIPKLIYLADQTPRIILTALEIIQGETSQLTNEILTSPILNENLQQLTGKYLSS